MSYVSRKISGTAYLIQGQKAESMYLIVGKDRALLIDAGMEKESLKDFCRTLTDKPLFCVLTHGHFDHIGMCGEFEDVYIDERDLELYKAHSQGEMASGFRCKPVEELRPMEKEYDLGDRKIVAVSAAGHTPGSVIFCDRKDHIVYTGDAVGSGCGVLMAPSLGSLTIREYGSSLLRTVEELKELGIDETWTFYGGHDGQQYHSRTGVEYNPVTLKMFEEMAALCEKMISHTADVKEDVRETPFGRMKETFGTNGTAELQLLEET